ncbi:MAG TPA: Abi family protein, partial [Gammaproteobacteria bacterium]|nr:Abi family protein [Gammaproteobacteria bacterium]
MRTSVGCLNPDPLRLLTMRTAAGYFFMDKQKFLKPPIDVLQQIDLLKQRNLSVHNLPFLKHSLSTVGYYRLTGYCKIFQDDDHIFKPNTTFQHIWELYSFDQELRILVINAIAKIEVALRASITNVMSMQFDSHWYLNSKLFKNEYLHNLLMQKIIKICQEPKEVFLLHYFEKYVDEYPPSWMIFECISFGTLSKAFRSLRNMQHKRKISEVFGYHSTLIESWLESLCYNRNLCAHHSRLWNRWFTMTPQIPHKLSTFTKFNTRIANKFYAQALIITLLLKNICPDYNWSQEL